MGGSSPSPELRVCAGCCAGRAKRCVSCPPLTPPFPTIRAIGTLPVTIAAHPGQINADDVSAGSITGSASASTSSPADLSTRNCAARASAGGSARSSSETQLARLGGPGRPLQKGLACLACAIVFLSSSRGLLIAFLRRQGEARTLRQRSTGLLVLQKDGKIQDRRAAVCLPRRSLPAAAQGGGRSETTGGRSSADGEGR